MVAFAQVGVFTGAVSVGDDGGIGEASFAGGTYTVMGSGSDIWNNTDGFYWIYKEVTGNWMVTVDCAWDEASAFRTAALQEWRKMGVMVRTEPEVAGSINVLGLLRSDLGANLQWRAEKDGASAEASGVQAKGTNDTDTIRLTRVGNTFTLLRKTADGQFRTIHTTSAVTMPDKVYYGLAVTAHEVNNIEAGKFSNLVFTPIEVVITATRTLPQDTFLPNSVINNVKLAIGVEAGKTADLTITEVLPTGWSIKTANPAVTRIEGNKAIWEMKGASGNKTITYTLNTGTDKEGVNLSGSVVAGDLVYGIAGGASLDIEGADQAFAPKLTKDSTLDGKLSPGEYEGAYSFTFDRVNDRAPGVLLSGKSYTFDESHATVYVFHNDNYICVGLDMVDPALAFNELSNVWQNDGVELYIDGDYSRKATKDGNEFGFQATVQGDGATSAGNNPPTPIAIGSAAKYKEAGYNGNYSTDGAYWDFGARAWDDGTGYTVEWKVDKQMCLDPANIVKVGFDIGVNELDPGAADRTGKWAWWHFDADTGLRKDAWDDERGWGVLELLATSQLPGVSDWQMF
jgi:hypothetical protein